MKRYLKFLISKIDRRSRSVSTTRTPYFNQNNHHHHHHHPQNYQNNNNNNNNYFMHQHQNQQEADLLFNGLNDLKKQQATVQQSKSTESILNDSATTGKIEYPLIFHLLLSFECVCVCVCVGKNYY